MGAVVTIPVVLVLGYWHSQLWLAWVLPSNIYWIVWGTMMCNRKRWTRAAIEEWNRLVYIPEPSAVYFVPEMWA